MYVLETGSGDEFPSGSDKSAAGMFSSTMISFNIPSEIVMSFADDVVLGSPNDHYHRCQLGAVLEFTGFKN